MHKLPKRIHKSIMAWIAFIELGFSSSIFASPEAMSVISGNASIIKEANGKLTIQSGNKTIVNWDSFSIGKGELVTFLQAGSQSAILNRVTGKLRSEILGSLESNGKVFLINPNGILIGKDAKINVNSFIASTFDVLNEEFLQSGNITFLGSSEASVVNLGKIKALDGDVFLIGATVESTGKIEAKQGIVALAAAEEVLLQPEGKDRILIRPKKRQESDPKKEEGIVHKGHISAVEAHLKAEGSAYTMAINVEGTVEAAGITQREGRILLVAEQGFNQVSGSLVAKNADASGGSIVVLGEIVSLRDKAMMDVSGEKQAGVVLAGGDYKGQNPDIPNAKHIYVGKDAQIKADGLREGNGGKIIFWGDESNHFYGSASARGGEKGGNGGFIEISSIGELRDAGKIDQHAPRGIDGINYIDPDDVQIVAYGSVDSKAIFRYEEPPTPSFYKFFPKTKIAKVDTGLLASRLNANSVIIDVRSSSDPDGTGLIQFFNSVQWSSPNTLTLRGNKVVFNGGPTRNDIIVGTTASTAKGTMLEVDADSVVIGSPNHITTRNTVLQAGTGDIVIKAPHSLEIYGGNGKKSSSSSIQAKGRGNITLNVGELILESGDKQDGSAAYIRAEEGNIVIAAQEQVSLLAREDRAQIAVHGAGNIYISGTDLALQGGNAPSSIETGCTSQSCGGGDITAKLSGDVKVLGGNSSRNADAYIVTNKQGHVRISAEGDISVIGGTSTSNQGSANACIATSLCINNEESLVLDAKNILLQGGQGKASSLLRAGEESCSDSKGSISLTALENVILVGGKTEEASASIQTLGVEGKNSITVSAQALYLDNTLVDEVKAPIGIATNNGDVVLNLAAGMGVQASSEGNVTIVAGDTGRIRIRDTDLHPDLDSANLTKISSLEGSSLVTAVVEGEPSTTSLYKEPRTLATPKGFEKPVPVEVVEELVQEKKTPSNSWALFDPENPILTTEYVSSSGVSPYYAEELSRNLYNDEVQLLSYQMNLLNSQMFFFNEVQETDWLKFYSILFSIKGNKTNEEYGLRRDVYFMPHIPLTTNDAIIEE